MTAVEGSRAALIIAQVKAGARAVPLSVPAVRLFASLPRLPGNPWVILSRKPGTHLGKLDDS